MAVADIDHLSGKIIGILAAGVVAAWLFGYEFRIWLQSPSGGEFIALMVILLFWITALGLTVFFLKSREVAMGAILLQTGALWSSLAEKFSSFTGIGVGLLAAVFFLGFLRGRADLANSVKIRFFRTAYRAIPVFTTGIVLFFTFYFLGALNVSNSDLHKAAIGFFFQSSESVTGQVFPGFAADKSVDEVFRGAARVKLPDATDAEIQEKVREMKDFVRRATGFPLNGGERFTDAFYNLTVAKLTGLLPAYRLFVLAAFGLLLFGAVKGLAFFVNWAVVGLTFLAFEALLAMNFMTIRLESSSREIIVVE